MSHHGRSATLEVNCSLSWLAHRIQRSTGEKPGSSLTVLPGVRVDGSKNTLRQCELDACGLVPQLTGVNIDDGPGPAAIATLILQLLNRCWCREQISIVEKPFQVQQNGFPRIAQRFI